MSRQIEQVIKRVDPEREYNLSHIRDEKIFPWARDIRTVRKVVLRDNGNERLLKVKITGEGRALDYKINGKNIINFLETYGHGLMVLLSDKK